MQNKSILPALAAAVMASAGIGSVVHAPTGTILSVDGTSATANQPTKQTPARPSGDASAMMRALYGTGAGRRRGLPQGPGWTRAQVKRMAKKRRNVLRNKRAQRGAK